MDQVIQTFPIIRTLKLKIPDCDIFVIIEDGHEKSYDFLTEKVNCFVLPEKSRTISGIHKYCVNLKDIFNIDVYFDLEGSLHSALLGLSFRALMRFGHNEGMRKYLYTNRLPGISHLPFDTKGLKLAGSYLSENFNHLKIEAQELREKVWEFNKVVELNLGPYLFVYAKFDDEKSMKWWQGFFISFAEQRLVIHCENEEEKEKFDLLFEGLKCHKNTEVILCPLSGELLRYLVNSKGWISDDLWFNRIASYLSVKGFYFPRKSESYLPDNHFVMTSHWIFNTGEKYFIRGRSSESLMEKDEFSDQNELVDYITEKLDL